MSEINPLNWAIQNISSGIKLIAINPIKDIICCALPWTKALWERHVQVTNNNNRALVQLIGGVSVINSLKKETAELASAAGIKGKVLIYTSLNAPFAGYQGIFDRLITMPLEHIKGTPFNEALSKETLLSKEDLNEKKWSFSDHETRYLLSRSIAEMTTCRMLKVISRIVIITLLIGLYFTSLGIIGSAIDFGAASLLYLAVDRWIGEKADSKAVAILTKRFENAGFNPIYAKAQALFAGVNTLKKIQMQQLELRKGSKICKLLIDAEGNNRFDFTRPSLQKRIQRLENQCLNLFQKACSSVNPIFNFASASYA